MKTKAKTKTTANKPTDSSSLENISVITYSWDSDTPADEKHEKAKNKASVVFRMAEFITDISRTALDPATWPLTPTEQAAFIRDVVRRACELRSAMEPSKQI